uniref:EP400 n=1 Tax=Macrostomum lignano TaxID=282301 RepID=A0A1I8FDZ3_9PLAT
YQLQHQQHRKLPVPPAQSQLQQQRMRQYLDLQKQDKADATQSYDGQIQPQQQQAPRDLTLYSLKFGINVPYSDVRRLVQTGSAAAVLAEGMFPELARVNWKLRRGDVTHPDSNRSQPPSGRASDPYVSLYLKFEPQTLAESGQPALSNLQSASPAQRSDALSVVRSDRSSPVLTSARQLPRGWARSLRASELEALAFSINGVKHLKAQRRPAGVRRVAQFLYPERGTISPGVRWAPTSACAYSWPPFTCTGRCWALNSDYFAALLARPDSLESRQGQVVLSEDTGFRTCT